MDSEVETLQERLKSFLAQLQAETGILERMVYKNKNQHRRCSYFQYLLKVRRDLRLLKSAKLEELLASCFQVIKGTKPKIKVYFLESLKRRRCEVGKYNFMERLLGAARLLSCMIEPMLKAATEVSILLARSFFMGFSSIILALLARLRVLVQQTLLDVVSVFNMVSSLSQLKQSVKINQEGVEVIREIYPANKEYVTLEFVWEQDQFVLHERTIKCTNESQDGDLDELKASINYESIESFLGEDDEPGPQKADAGCTTNEPADQIRAETEPLVSPTTEGDNLEQNDVYKHDEGVLGTSGTAGTSSPPKVDLETPSNSSARLNPLNLQSGKWKVAFISVKTPAPSATKPIEPQRQESENESDSKEDQFFNLLTAGNLKGSLF